MVRIRYLVAAFAIAAGIGAGAPWAASGGTTTSPGTTTPSTTTPGTTTPTTPRSTPSSPNRNHCPGMGSGSGSSGSNGVFDLPGSNL